MKLKTFKAWAVMKGDSLTWVYTYESKREARESLQIGERLAEATVSVQALDRKPTRKRK